MRIKYLVSKDKRVQGFNNLIKNEFPQLMNEVHPDIYLVAGGDGAMLHAIHETIDTEIPYFGKAMGTFNFLMNCFDGDSSIINALLDNKIDIEIFKSHAIVAYLDGKKLGEAVNDVILGDKLTGYHSFNISTKSGDFSNFNINGSGICISTAIGSTAFNYNNNGRILPLNSCLLSITGVVCNRYLNDIVPFTEIHIKSNGSRIYLTNVESKILEEGSELVLKRGTEIKIGFIDRKEFLKRRIEIAHRFRK